MSRYRRTTKVASRVSSRTLKSLTRELQDAGDGVQWKAKTPAARQRDIGQLLRLADRCRLLAHTAAAEGNFLSLNRLNVNWKNLRDDAAARIAQFLRYPNVLWVSVGYRHQDNVWTDTPAIVVYVRRKWSARQAATKPRTAVLPRYIRLPTYGRVVVDVVPVGRVIPTALVSPGERIEPTADRTLYGTIGLFARELDSNRPVAISAGHVLAEAHEADPIRVRDSPDGPTIVLGGRARAVTQRIDIGSADAFGHAIRNALPGYPKLAGIRDVDPAEVGEAFVTFGATTGRITHGILLSPPPEIANIGLARPIAVRIEVAPGDSGALLMDLYNFGVGILHGYCTFDPSIAVYSPLKSALGDIGCAWDPSL